VNELESQARFQMRVGLSGPASEQVPGSEAKVLGDQQPDSHQGSRNLLGQQLAEASLQALGIAGFRAATGFGSLGLDRGQGSEFRASGVQFFFEGRSPGRCGGRYEC
jgi:hypothetical protein